MNIDQQLRAALSQEAEMKTAPAPDLDRLIIGGKARQRRRNRTRLGAAAAALLVAGGAYGVTKNDHGTAVEPAGQPPQANASHTYPDTRSTIQPGTYRMLVGENDAGAVVYANITFNNTAWQSYDYPVLLKANSNGGVAVFSPLGISAGTGCFPTKKLNRNLGDTPQSLAQQLAQLPQSTVLQAPTPVQAFGRDAVHLRLRINNNCSDWYRVAETIRGGHGITFDPVRAVVIDFWLVDEGGPVVIDTWHEIHSPSALVDQIARVRDSITLSTVGG